MCLFGLSAFESCHYELPDRVELPVTQTKSEYRPPFHLFHSAVFTVVGQKQGFLDARDLKVQEDITEAQIGLYGYFGRCAVKHQVSACKCYQIPILAYFEIP